MENIRRIFMSSRAHPLFNNIDWTHSYSESNFLDNNQLPHVDCLDSLNLLLLTYPCLSDFSKDILIFQLKFELQATSFHKRLRYTKTGTCNIFSTQQLQRAAKRRSFWSIQPSTPILSWCATSPTKSLMLNQMSQHYVITSSCWIQLLLMPLERTSSLYKSFMLS